MYFIFILAIPNFQFENLIIDISGDNKLISPTFSIITKMDPFIFEESGLT
jgi:hypothetical protein